VIADLSGAPGTRVRLTDRRILTGIIDTLIFVSARDALSIPYSEITHAWGRSNLAAWEEPWGLCLELRSGDEVWLKLCKGHAQYAIRVIEEKNSHERTEGRGGPTDANLRRI
jgi:hypothetical protein